MKKKRKQKLVQIKCEYCSIIFTGEAWRTYCLDCYKEKKKQADIANGVDLSMTEKECLSCHTMFNGQYWAKVCPPCYHKAKDLSKNPKKEQLTCEVCNCVFTGEAWRTHCRDCWVDQQASAVYMRQQERSK